MKKCYNNNAGDRARGDDGEAVPSLPMLVIHIDGIKPSPFQPAGRPSANAVAEIVGAIADAGSLDQLMGEQAAAGFERLSEEARDLVSLAWDIRNHGVRVPLEARRVEDGTLELLSGHRRLAASKIAGLARVPLTDRGAMSDAHAKAELLRANLHRTGFKALQQARLLQSLGASRADAGSQDTVRTLAQVAGMSHGHAGALLQIAEAISPELVAAIGGEDRLTTASFRSLLRIACESDPQRRVALARREVGLRETNPKVEQPPFDCRPRRGGGFELRCNVPVSSLSELDAGRLRQLLHEHLTSVQTHLTGLQRGVC